ncbi:hypothetical protein ACOMHN_001246 [Nucella lapillus]
MAAGFPFQLPQLAWDFNVESTVADGGLFFDGVTDEERQHSVENSPLHQSDSGVSGIVGKSPAPNTDSQLLDEMLHQDLDVMENMAGPLLSFVLGDEHFESDKLPSHQGEDLVTNCPEGNSSSEQTDRDSVVHTSDLSDQVNTTDPQVSDKQKTRSQSVAEGKKLVPDSDCESGIHHHSESGIHRDSQRKKANSNTPNSDTGDNDDVSSALKRKGSIRAKQVAKLPSATGLEERNHKNAENARQNRLKKKEYVGNLEQKTEHSRKRIGDLESAVNSVKEERDSYKREAEYLKLVLANQNVLAGLLKNIPNVDGVTLSSSLRKRVAEADPGHTPAKKARHAGLV